MSSGDPRQATMQATISDPQSGMQSVHFKLYGIDLRTNHVQSLRDESLDVQCTEGSSECACTPAGFCYKTKPSLLFDTLMTQDLAHNQKLRLEVVTVNRAGSRATSSIDVEVDLHPPTPGKHFELEFSF
jgi:hypothetical protein